MKAGSPAASYIFYYEPEDISQMQNALADTARKPFAMRESCDDR